MLKIRPMEQADVRKILVLTDREIGSGYYSASELENFYRRSRINHQVCSLVLEAEDGEILGIRLTFPPGEWEAGKGHGLKTERWPYGFRETAYFQSIFVSSKLRGQGWGAKLSQEALRRLRSNGVKGVVCHSWKESPNNSSYRYLYKMGFQPVAEYPEYWKDVNYNCVRCQQPPCLCTAQEMYLDLERNYEHVVLA